MSRNRVIYNVEAVFLGPAPDSGYHFMGQDGVLQNGPTSTSFNLVKHLPRIQNVNWSAQVERENVLNLGKEATLRQPIFEPPIINLNFDYIQAGALNEARLGFYVNHPLNYSPYNGQTYYPDNFDVLSIGGFLNRTDDREVNPVRWPYLYRDKRNIFVAVNNNDTDLNNQYSTYHEVDPNATGWSVYAFGGCYLNSYVATASVGGFPQASVSYVADNVLFCMSGSGAYIPAVDTRTYSGYNHINYALPSPSDGPTLPSTLLPGDITIDILSRAQYTGVPSLDRGVYYSDEAPYYDTIINVGASFTDIKIQSYEITLSFEREDLKNFGYRLPTDRVITFPLFVTTEITALVGDFGSGSLENFVRNNDDFDITIKLRNPLGKGESTGMALRYDFRGAKLNNYDYDLSIGSNKIINLSFSTEIDPTDLTRGFFLSGLMNSDVTGTSSMPTEYLTTNLGDRIVTNLGEPIVKSAYVLYY